MLTSSAVAIPSAPLRWLLPWHLRGPGVGSLQGVRRSQGANLGRGEASPASGPECAALGSGNECFAEP